MWAFVHRGQLYAPESNRQTIGKGKHPIMQRARDVSEDQLLEAFLPIIKSHNTKADRLMLGPGDDCAVLNLRDGLTVITTDTQTEDQDFRCTWANGMVTSGYDVGWKAATQNLADIAAMGAVPQTLLISLTLTPDTPVTWVEDFARGVTEACTAQGAEKCSISGGDLGAGSEISVTVTAVGTCLTPVLRSGAQTGDALVLAGAVGTAAAGLALLENSSGYQLTPGLSACIEAQQRPCSPLASGASAAHQLTAMLDVSDGLLRDAGRIARASCVNIDIDAAALSPWVARAQEAADLCTAPSQNADDLALHWVLTGGEDHGLLATCPADSVPADFTRIGRVTKPGGAVTVDGKTYRAKGWDHFEATAR